MIRAATRGFAIHFVMCRRESCSVSRMAGLRKLLCISLPPSMSELSTFGPAATRESHFNLPLAWDERAGPRLAFTTTR